MNTQIFGAIVIHAVGRPSRGRTAARDSFFDVGLPEQSAPKREVDEPFSRWRGCQSSARQSGLFSVFFAPIVFRRAKRARVPA